MSKLEDLKTIVAEMFEGAESKESIEQLAKLNNSIEDVQKEQDDLTEKNAELIKSYKDLVKHSSFKDDKVPTDPVGETAPSFEDALNTFIENNKEK